jgi:TP901 family phage tail tape measure protein
MSTILGTLGVKLEAQVAEFSRNMSQAMSRVEEASEELKKVGTAATAAGAAFAGFAGFAVRTAAQFETGMVKVGAVANATGDQLDNLKDRALDLAGETQYTARQVADGMSFMAMAGAEVSQISKGMPSVLQLATAGMVDLADAADITTNIMTGMGLSMNELGMANDVLVSAMTGANVDVRMLGESFKYAGPAAKSAGIEFEEAAAMIALLGNAGIQGSLAGTSLRNAITKLLSPAGEAKKLLDQMGVSVSDSNGKMRPFVDIIRQIESGMEGLGQTEKTAKLMTIFGQRAGPAMAELLSQGSDALEAFKSRLSESGGTAKRIADQQMNTLAGSMQRLNSKFEAMQIGIGERFAPLIGKVADALGGLLDAFNGLSDGMKDAIAYSSLALGGLAAIAGSALLVAANVAKIKAAFVALGVVVKIALLPALKWMLIIGGAVAAVVAGVGALKMAWDHNLFGIKDTTKAVANWIKDAWETMVDFMTYLLKGIWKELQKFMNWLGSGAFQAYAFVTGMDTDQVYAMLQEMKKGGGLFSVGEGSGAQEFATKFAEAVKRDLGNVGKSFKEGVDVMAEFFGFVDKGKQAAEEAAGSTKEASKTLKQAVTEDVAKPMADVGAAIEDLGTATSQTEKKLRNVNVDAWVETPAQRVANAIEGAIGSKAFDAAKAAGGAVARTGTGLAQGAGNLVGGTIGQTEAGGVIGAAKQGFQQGGLFGAAGSVLAEFVKKTKAFGEMARYIGKIFGKIVERIKPLAKAVKPLGILIGDIALILAEQLTPVFKVLAKVFEVVFHVLRGLALFVLHIFKALGDAWNWIVKGLANFVDKIPGLGGLADKIDDLAINMNGVNRAIRKLKYRSWENAQEEGKADEERKQSTDDLTEASREAAASLTNVPQGYKVALRRFQAISGEGSGSGLTDEERSKKIIIESVQVMDPLEMWDRLKQLAENDNYLTGGTPVSSGPAYAVPRNGA